MKVHFNEDRKWGARQWGRCLRANGLDFQRVLLGLGPIRKPQVGVAAVKAGRVHALRHPDALLPGPRMGEVAALMAEAFCGNRAERP